MIDSQDSALLVEEDYSPVEVMWVSPHNDTVMIAKGVDTRTGECVEWAGSPETMGALASEVNYYEDTVVALVPYWAERSRG